MEATCPHCGKKYQVPDTAVGKQARCANPECQQTFLVAVPEGTPSGAASSPAGPAIATPPAAATPAAPSPAPAAPPPMPPAAPPPLVPPAQPWGAQPVAAPMGYPPRPGLPVAPAYPPRQRNSKPLVLGLVGVLAAVVVIVGLYFIITALSGPSSAAIPGWTKPYVMDGAKGVGYVNAEKLRKGQAYALLKKTLDRGGPIPLGPMAGAPVDLTALDKIDEVFAVGNEGGVLVVVRTNDDMTLDHARDTLQNLNQRRSPFGARAKEPAGGAKKTLGTIEYVSVQGAVLAKTESKTFCFTEKEESLKQLSDRLAKKSGGTLDKRLQDVMKDARGDHFIAVVDLGKLAPASELRRGIPGASGGAIPDWVAFGLSADSSVSIQGALGLPNVADAEKIKKDYDASMSQMNELMKNFGTPPPGLPAEQAKEFQKVREKIEKSVSMVRAIRLSQSGNTIRVSATWRVKDIEELIEDAVGGRGGGMMGGGLPF